jgi:hypothetical protein
MAGIRRLALGETISSVADESGLVIQSIWNDSRNATIRQRRQSWDRIAPDDEVYVRDSVQKEEAAATQMRHRFRRKSQYAVVIRLDLPVPDARTDEERFTLTSSDGSYEETKTPEDDLIPGDEFIDLHFSGLKKTKRYSLSVDPGNGDEPYMVFENVSYEDLAQLCAEEGAEYSQHSSQQDEEGTANDRDDPPYPDEPDDEEG